jgi:hypothetical protein
MEPKCFQVSSMDAAVEFVVERDSTDGVTEFSKGARWLAGPSECSVGRMSCSKSPWIYSARALLSQVLAAWTAPYLRRTVSTVGPFQARMAPG